MAKKKKDAEPGGKKPSVKGGSSGEGGAARKKPTLLKRIVNTIESISKDKKGAKADAAAKRELEQAVASRKQSLDQAISGLTEAPVQSPAALETVPSAPEPAGDGAIGEAAPEFKSQQTFTQEESAPEAVAPRWDELEEEKDSKKSSEASNPVISENPNDAASTGVAITISVNAPSDSAVTAAKVSKFEIEPPRSGAARKTVAPPDLAEQIFATRLVLLVRDPEMIYAYWDVTEEDRKLHRLDSLVPPRHLALRLYDLGRDAQPRANALVYVDFLLQPGVDSRYLRLPLKDRWWRADLGVKDELVGFTVLAHSNTVRSPRDQVAGWGDTTGRPLARPIGAIPDAVAGAAGAPGESGPRTRDQIFEGAFRLSGGTVQHPGAPGEVTEAVTETWTVLRVRQAGSSEMISEEEQASQTTLKVRRAGASDLSSRQG